MAKYARIRHQAEFSSIYKNGKKWHCEQASVYFLASKKIGNAVKRNKAKRRLRAVFGNLCARLKNGSYIIVAKENITSATFDILAKNLNWSMSKMGAFK